jgi:hypothetical protein
VTPHSPHRTRALAPFAGVVVLVAAVLVGLSLPANAAAKGTKCGEQIVADWFDNGRIDRLYPLHCYEEAIDAIPKDIRDYADAADVINRALQAALNGHLDPGGPDPTPGNNRNVEGGKGGSKKDETGNPQATGQIDTSGPSSVPIPLLVLGGISLALLAAGGYGYLSRRRQAGGDDDSFGDGDPLT